MAVLSEVGDRAPRWPSVASSLEHARSSHMYPLTLAQPHGSPVYLRHLRYVSALTENDQRDGEPREQRLGISASRRRFFEGSRAAAAG